MILDGWDPIDDRNQFDMYAGMALMRVLYAFGIDVWMVNYRVGAESVREHINDAALALYEIQKHESFGHIDVVIGVSEGGVVGKAALASMEHVYDKGDKEYADDIEEWFTYQDDPVRRDTAVNVNALISWDSPQRGLIGVPRDLLLSLRTMEDLSRDDLVRLCDPKGKFLAFIPGLGPILALWRERVITKTWLVERKKGQSLAQTIDPIVNGGPTRDFMLDYCTTKDPSSCNGSESYTFRTTIRVFNGDGYPNTVRLLGFAQGSWEPHQCRFADQWGPNTCSGPSVTLYENGEYVEHPAGELTSPNNIRVFNPGDTFAWIDLPSDCRNDVNFKVGSNDLRPGSTTDLVGGFLTQATTSDNAKLYFSPSYQATADALDMSGELEGTPFHDVLWQERAYSHQAVDRSRDTVNFVMKYIWEYTFGDEDGFATCEANPDFAFDAGDPGKLCSCDADDSNPNVIGECDIQSDNPNYCAPRTVCDSWECGSVSDGCGGTIHCGPCQPLDGPGCDNRVDVCGPG